MARRRSRWMSSATLASSAKWVKARMTGIAWWMSMPSNIPARSARSISERRTRNDSTRARSTRSKTSSPFCSRTVSPRMVPSSRMSSRMGSVASRPTLVRRTEPIGASEMSGPSAINQVSATGRRPAVRERRRSDHSQHDGEQDEQEHDDERNRDDGDRDANPVVLLRTDTERTRAERPHRRLVLQFGHLTRAHIDRRIGRPQLWRQKIRHVNVHVMLTGAGGQMYATPGRRLHLLAVDGDLRLHEE